MDIKREEDCTRIKSSLFGVDVDCFIGKSGQDNSDAKFNLKIDEGGQVFSGCNLEMCGPLERTHFLAFLKQLVYEIELLDGKR